MNLAPEDSSREDLQTQFDIPPEEISFIERSESYCICFIDMVNSTNITAQIYDRKKVRTYYAIFLNAIATLVKGFDATVVKNIGDALIFYFR